MNNYIVLDTLSRGEFGEVLKIKNKFTEKILAVKVESCDVGLLEYETKIYNCLSGLDNIPKIRSYKTDGIKNYLFMDLMDYNLKKYKTLHYNSVNYLTDINNIIIVLISTLKSIHERGIIHRDIKPENICFQDNNIKLIDFGLSKLIDVKDGLSMDTKTINRLTNIIGTPNYVSLDVIDLYQPTIRDDLESLCYIYIYLLLDTEAFNKYSCEDNRDKKVINCIYKYITNERVQKQVSLHLKVCREFNRNMSQQRDKPPLQKPSNLLYTYLARIYR